MLGEIIIIETDAIETVIHEELPAKNRKSTTWKALNETHFSTLWAILSGSDNSDELEKQITVVTSREGEVWAFIIPDELTVLLSELSGPKKAECIKSWAALESKHSWGLKEDQVSSLVSTLIEFAKEAKTKGHKLIYWGAL